MRTLLLIALLSLAGCATAFREWDRPGSDREAAKQDLVECRRAASGLTISSQVDPLPLYPRYYGRASFRSGYDTDQGYYVQRLTNNCMRNKGYELNAVPADGAGPAPAISPRAG